MYSASDKMCVILKEHSVEMLMRTDWLNFTVTEVVETKTRAQSELTQMLMLLANCWHSPHSVSLHAADSFNLLHGWFFCLQFEVFVFLLPVCVYYFSSSCSHHFLSSQLCLFVNQSSKCFRLLFVSWTLQFCSVQFCSAATARILEYWAP